MNSPSAPSRIAVVIPSYKVTRHIAGVVAAIGGEVALIYCVDDACPERSGDFIEANIFATRSTKGWAGR